MKSSTSKAIAAMESSLSAEPLRPIKDFDEKIEVLTALKNLPGVEAELIELLNETISDLSKIHEAATKVLSAA